MTPIRDRILLTLMAVILLMLGPALFAVFTLASLNRTTAALRASSELPINAIRDRLAQCETLLDLHGATGDPDYSRRAAECSQQVAAKALELAVALESRPMPGAADLRSPASCYGQPPASDAGPETVQEHATCGRRLSEVLRGIAVREVEYRTGLAEAAERAGLRALHGLWFAVVSALVLALLLASHVTSRIVPPLRRLLSGARRVAQGRFDEEVPVTSDDEIGELTREFNRMNRGLATLDRLKAEFLSVASHELRSPVVTMRGYVELLRDEMDTLPAEERRRILDLLDEETDLLVRYVNDFLDMSHLEAGRLKFEPRWIPLRPFFEGEVEPYAYKAQRKGIALRSEVEGELPEQFRGDPDRLTQVLRNLLENALRYTPAGGTITARLRGGPDGSFELQIRDTGPGIAAEEATKIFEKYYSGSRAARGEGSGLGLAISRAIVEAHGGQLWAESQAGGGAEFICRLPVSSSVEA